MRRIQLFEFEDQAWFPAAIRRYMTDFLAAAAKIGAPVYGTFARRLAEALERTGSHTVLDLGAGAGGPAPVLLALLRERGAADVRYVLTDYYPNLTAWRRLKQQEPAIEWREQPVDATHVSATPGEFRLMCNSFHHFPPTLARRILQNARENRAGIAIVEAVEPNAFGFVGIWIGFVLMFLVTPFIRPFSVGRLFFTYLVPIVPLCTLWDGLASWARIYSPADLAELTADLHGDDYRWQIATIPAERGPGKVTCLFGEPVGASRGANAA